MNFQEITSTLGIMTIGYFIGRLIEFLIPKINKSDGEKNEKRASK